MVKIVLIDDERLVTISFEKYIKTQLSGYEIIGTFTNGCEALKFLETNSADIVISDICMPQMDGLELSKILSERMPQCVVIILSGFSEFEYAQKAIQYNVFTYLLKPLDYRELGKVLNDASIASARRKAVSYANQLTEDPIGQFFRDLLFGCLSSQKELNRRFCELNFPFALDESCGYLLKLTFKCSSGMIIPMFSSILDTLRLALENGNIYYIRHTENEFFLAVLLDSDPSHAKVDHISAMLAQHENLSCEVKIYRYFSSLKEFVRIENSISNHPGSEVDLNNQLILKALSYIQQHYAKDLSREAVASALYLSPSHFSFLFKQETGYTFKDYLTNVRMQVAIGLLSTPISINDIAEKVGYPNRNRFIINFKNYTSYTPTEYRKQVLSMEDENL